MRCDRAKPGRIFFPRSRPVSSPPASSELSFVSSSDPPLDLHPMSQPITGILTPNITPVDRDGRVEPLVLAAQLETDRLAGLLARDQVEHPLWIGDGPAVDGEHTRLLITIDRRHGPDLTQALHAMMAVRSASKGPDRLQVTVDPPDWGGD